jgi:LPS sulfotransferase NodH
VRQVARLSGHRPLWPPIGGPGANPGDDLAVGAPTRDRYVIAAIPRTGSTLLAAALWGTGLAGAPGEYLNPLQRRHFEKRWGPMPLAVYVERLERHRTSANGVFGIKIHHHHHLRWVKRLGLDLTSLVRGAKYVATWRVDRVAQAVSLEIAHQTGRWSTAQPPTRRRPVYDEASIRRRLRFIERSEHGWEQFFAESEISPMRLTYEKLVANLEASTRAALDFLGVASAEPIDVSPPPLARQADEVNVAWVERFNSA